MCEEAGTGLHSSRVDTTSGFSTGAGSSSILAEAGVIDWPIVWIQRGWRRILDLKVDADFLLRVRQLFQLVLAVANG